MVGDNALWSRMQDMDHTVSNTHPRAASRFLMSLRIFHCSISLSSSVALGSEAADDI